MPIKNFDEMYTSLPFEPGNTRPHYTDYGHWLARQSAEIIASQREQAEVLFRKVGITFAVYGAKDEDGGGNERLIPFDLIPRIIPLHEWAHLRQGLIQRTTALNRFLHDVYHDQEIIKAGIIQSDLINKNKQFISEMKGINLPHQIYAHVAGIDMVRAAYSKTEAEYYVLEDNLRVPSGVSYMLENRKMMMRLFPELFKQKNISPIAHYPDLLLETLIECAPSSIKKPTVVVLTPGMYNSAYFEHAFLAQQMGVDLVEGQDLVVKNNFLWMKTTRGLKQVDVIYRRIDYDYLDPVIFNQSSTLGCKNLMSVYRAGNVNICNAIGAGLADDKSIYPYVPKMIEFYLGETPILKNVPTWVCHKPDDLAYVLANLHNLVIKEVHGFGGYGMLVGPTASQTELEKFRHILRTNPSNYIAQPTLSLSTCPTFVESGIAPRHIDLRPFVLNGKEVRMAPGGLTRVALEAGSLIVNSSQGGGTKDTWILES